MSFMLCWTSEAQHGLELCSPRTYLANIMPSQCYPACGQHICFLRCSVTCSTGKGNSLHVPKGICSFFGADQRWGHLCFAATLTPAVSCDVLFHTIILRLVTSVPCSSRNFLWGSDIAALSRQLGLLIFKDPSELYCSVLLYYTNLLAQVSRYRKV